MESLAWGAAAYGVPGLGELYTRPHPLYFNWVPVIGAGLAFAVASFVALLALIRSFLGGSSRGHRIIVECAIILALGLPLTGIELASDANRYFDRSLVENLRPTITDKFEQIHRRKRGRSSFTYHLRINHLVDPQTRAPLPAAMKVSQSLYVNAQVGTPLEVSVRRGALGFTWIDSVHLP